MGKDEKPKSNILIVDDISKNIQVLGNVLREEGYQLSFATGGPQAVEMASAERFDLILLDVMMPGMDGFEVCRRLKELPTAMDVPIIFLTAKAETESVVKGFEVGAVDYVAKPFNARELLARVRTHLALKKAREDLVRKNKEIRRMSITDPLTGCFNRGYITERLPSEIQRSKRFRHPLAVFMCDIDHFKIVNDTHGHQAGDTVLQGFVARVRDQLREDVDWLARYGGEEFLAVLPETSIQSAVRVAERLRDAISTVPFVFEGGKVRITSSFGVSGVSPWTGDAEPTLDSLIRQVDRRLYQAKTLGRNRVCADDGNPFPDEDSPLP